MGGWKEPNVQVEICFEEDETNGRQAVDGLFPVTTEPRSMWLSAD
jgi:hypothetical protein